MKDLESKLKRLPLAAPSPGLDERVITRKPGFPLHSHPAPRRVPLWATAAIAVATALAGFVAGAMWRSDQSVRSHAARTPVKMYVIYDLPALRNPFDFTLASDFFPAQKLETTVRTQKGA